MFSRPAVLLAMASALVVTQLLAPAHAQAQRPEPAVSPRTASLSATPSPAIAGERVTLSATFSRTPDRPALAQVKRGRTWRTVARSRTRSGRVNAAVTVASASTYRIQLPATRVHGHLLKATTSRPVGVDVVPQTATLVAAGSGDQRTLTATFSPARAGRTVTLLDQQGQTAGTSLEDGNGRATFTVSLRTASTSYHATAGASGGAAAATSAPVTLPALSSSGGPSSPPSNPPSSPASSGSPTGTPTTPTGTPSPPALIPAAQAAGDDVYDRSAFLYTGDNPIQTGVAPGTISPDLATVLEGTVTDTSGAPIAGASVFVSGRAQLGRTTTRADGTYHLVVNGGSQLVLEVTDPGKLTVQRTAPASGGGFVPMPTIVLTDLNPVSQSVASDAATSQLVQLETSPDDGCSDPVTHAPVDCSRSNALFVPSGTTATSVAADGTSTPLSGSLTMRATEYTQGATGPQAMPGDLPAASGYTYAVDLTIDGTGGAASVTFNNPLYNYVTNYLQFPVGTHVPSGYYDTQTGQWVASTDGRVVKILSITGGVATVDTDGDGVADTGPAGQTLSTAELQQLGSSYQAGDELWRVPVTHFTPWDYNFPYGCATICKPPTLKPYHDPRFPDPCQAAGSVIGCENQSLGERLPIGDTPFELAYDSSSTAGYTYGRHVQVPLDQVIPAIADDGYSVSVTVAGKTYTKSSPLPPALGQTWDVNWDGKDAFGNPVYGPVTATVSASANYHLVYKKTADAFESSWAQWDASNDTSMGVDRDAGYAGLTRSTTLTFDGGRPPSAGLAGWSIDQVAHYDTSSNSVTFGDGTTWPSDGSQLVGVVANDDFCDACQGTAATPTGDFYEAPMATGPDGSVYFYDSSRRKIQRISPTSGRAIATVAGTGDWCNDPTCIQPDGTPALQQPISEVDALTVGPDGTLYGTSTFASPAQGDYLFAISPAGAFRIVAGTGAMCNAHYSAQPAYDPTCGDGGPATSAPLWAYGRAIAVTSAGIYLADFAESTIRLITPDGIIRTAFGCGPTTYSTCPVPADGARAANDKLIFDGVQFAMAPAPDGSLWFTGTTQHQVVQVDPMGVDHVVGNPNSCDNSVRFPCGDGGPVDSAAFGSPRDITVSQQGTVYVLDVLGSYGGFYGTGIRAFTPGGAIERLAGNPEDLASGDPWIGKDPAGQNALAHVLSISHLQVLPSGEVDFAVDDNGAPVGLRSVQTRAPSTPRAVSPDGSTYLVFDRSGRETQVQDALTNAILLRLGYDDAGDLVTLTDQHGAVTTIERATDGTPTAIVAPSGSRTTLTVGSDGYLSSVGEPNGRTAQATYSSGGLLQTFTDLVGGHHTMTYGSDGRLLTDQNAAGATQTLSCTQKVNSQTGPCAGDADNQTVAITSPSGKVTTYSVTENADGSVTRTEVRPSGATTAVTSSPDRLSIKAVTAAGTEQQLFEPDPRFGLGAPFLADDKLTRTDGSVDEVVTSRTATLANPADPFSATDVATTITHDGQATQDDWTWDAVSQTGTATSTSPGGRTSVRKVDAMDRPTMVTTDGGASTTYTYDAHGYPKTATAGSSTASWAYSASGHLTAATTPGGATTDYTYDPMGRVATQTDGAHHTWTATDDGNGNLTGFDTPDGGHYALSYDATGQLSGVALPGASGAITRTTNSDGRYASLSLPGGPTMTNTYGATTGLLSGSGDGTVSRTFTVAPSSEKITSAGWSNGAIQETLATTYSGVVPTRMAFTGTSPGTIATTWTPEGRLAGTTVTAGSVSNAAIPRTYDADGLLTGIGGFTLTRSPSTGATTSITDGTATYSQTTDSRFLMTGRTLTVNGNAVFAESDTPDADGRIGQATVGGTSTSYTYDAAGRLVGAGGASYSYDGDGNLLTGPGGTATYDNGDRLTSLAGQPVTVDDAGRLTHEGSSTFAYDAQGDLIQATVSGVSATYAYDALGRRVAETTGGQTTHYLYGDPTNSLQVSAVVEPDGATDLPFYDDRGLLLGFRRNGTTMYYVGADHLGSPRVVTDATGQIVDTIGYDAWGNATRSTSFELPFGFAGGLVDPVTGWVHMGVRDYDPQTGRFTTMDRVLFRGGTDLFVYVSDDPVSQVDRSGGFNIGVGLSAYAGGGGGISINLDTETGQASICAEAGLGIGESFEVNNNAPSPTQVSIGAEATAKAGILGVTGSVGATTGPCMGYYESAGAKATIGPLNGQVNFNNQNGEWSRQPDVWSGTTAPDIPGSITSEKAEAKVFAQGCVGLGT